MFDLYEQDDGGYLHGGSFANSNSHGLFANDGQSFLKAPVEEEQQQQQHMYLNGLSDQLNVLLNLISVVSGLVVVLAILIINYFNRRLMDRVSIRFTMAISLVDSLKALVILRMTYGWQPDPECTWLGFSVQFLTLLYLFFNVAIAVNLQLVFVNAYVFDPQWERVYWFVALFMASVLPTLPLVAGRLGAGRKGDACEYKDSNSLASCLWVGSTLLVWIFLSCVYCTIVVILTIITLQKKVNVLDRVAYLAKHNPTVHSTTPTLYHNSATTNTNNITPGESTTTNGHPNMFSSQERAIKVKHDIKRLIRRVTLYCVIPVITQVGFLVGRTSHCLKIQSPILRLVSVIGTDIPGILNLIAFLIDPAFSNAICQLFSDRVQRQSQLPTSFSTTLNNSGTVDHITSNDGADIDEYNNYDDDRVNENYDEEKEAAEDESYFEAEYGLITTATDTTNIAAGSPSTGCLVLKDKRSGNPSLTHLNQGRDIPLNHLKNQDLRSDSWRNSKIISNNNVIPSSSSNLSPIELVNIEYCDQKRAQGRLYDKKIKSRRSNRGGYERRFSLQNSRNRDGGGGLSNYLNRRSVVGFQTNRREVIPETTTTTYSMYINNFQPNIINPGYPLDGLSEYTTSSSVRHHYYQASAQRCNSMLSDNVLSTNTGQSLLHFDHSDDLMHQEQLARFIKGL